MGGRLDLPAVVVEWAARLLSVDRAEWGQAMLGELEQYKGLARWRFALGCAAAVVGLPRRSGNGRWVSASVLVASIASAGLVSYSFVRYPGMATGAGTWMALAAFAVVLAGFVGIAGVTTRQPSIGITELVSGCALAVLSIVVVELSTRSKASMLLLLIIPVASIVVGVVAARRGRTRSVARRAALVSAVVASLAVFLVLAADVLVTGGRPYDAGQLRDFATSGYPDMATYVVNDDLGTAMVLLLLMSVITALLGSAGATLATRRVR
jgi:hypothetical protein